jgi:hypothetical protein
MALSDDEAPSGEAYNDGLESVRYQPTWVLLLYLVVVSPICATRPSTY